MPLSGVDEGGWLVWVGGALVGSVDGLAGGVVALGEVLALGLGVTLGLGDGSTPGVGLGWADSAGVTEGDGLGVEVALPLLNIQLLYLVSATCPPVAPRVPSLLTYMMSNSSLRRSVV